MAISPFFSGRIPQSLLDAVESYRQKTGESKTDVLVKALSAYIGLPVEEQLPQKPLESNWRKSLEARIETLERLMAGMQQALDRIPVDKDRSGNLSEQTLPGQMTLEDLQKLEDSKGEENTQESTDNNIDNSIDNKGDNNNALPDNNTDNDADNSDYKLNHAEVADQTRMTIGTIRNYHSQRKTITKKEQGRRYIPQDRNTWIAEIIQGYVIGRYQSDNAIDSIKAVDLSALVSCVPRQCVL